MEKPLVSVIIPCYEQAEFLDEALQSVLEQTYDNWECIIIDDGSPDNTEEVSLLWTSRDNRFRYFRQKNLGVSSARNNGIIRAKGEFILPLDADDKISSSYLKRAIEAFMEDPGIKLVYGRAEKFGKGNGYWNLKSFSLENLARFNMIYCSALYKKSDWKDVGGYDEKMIDGIEDWDFWISLLKGGGKVRYLDELVFFYRIKECSRTTKLSQKKLNNLYDYLSVKHPFFFTKHLGSFIYLNQKNSEIRREFNSRLMSRKFVLDLFSYTLFKFSIFGKYPLKEEEESCLQE